jgi:transposase-like protein
MDIINNIKELFSNLDFSQKIQVVKELSDSLEADKNKIVENIKYIEPVEDEQNPIQKHCPHCHNKSIIKWGNYQGRDRYKCNKCNRTFTAFTGTPIHNIKKKELWDKFGDELFNDQYFTIKELAKRIGISEATAFDWRHKLLGSLDGFGSEFAGITEMDDVWVLYSQKGRKGLDYSRKRGGSHRQGDNNFQAKLLITTDRENTIDMSVVRIGRLKEKDIERAVGEKISKDVTLVSDKHPSIASFAKEAKIEHVTFKAEDHVKDSVHHVQKINNIASRFKTIINHKLRGVSTKYLQNYANWFSINEQYKEVQNKAKEILKITQSTINSWDKFVNTEKLYKEFIDNFSVRTYRCPTVRAWKAQNWNFDNAILTS